MNKLVKVTLCRYCNNPLIICNDCKCQKHVMSEWTKRRKRK